MGRTSAAIKAFGDVAKACGMTMAEAEAAMKAMASALHPGEKVVEPKHPLVIAVEKAVRGRIDGNVHR